MPSLPVSICTHQRELASKIKTESKTLIYDSIISIVPNKMSHRGMLCEIAFVCRKDNLGVGRKWMINNSFIVCGKWGNSCRTNLGIIAKFCITANCTRAKPKINKCRMVFEQLIEMYLLSVFFRSERSRVCEKWHPGRDCAQRPQCGTRKWRAHLHETTDGECECPNILLSPSCSCFNK